MTRAGDHAVDVTPNRSRNITVATAGIVLGSSPGMLLPFAVTAWFGAGHATDAYFLAVTAAVLPATVLTVVMERAVVPFAADAVTGGPLQLSLLVRRLALQASGLAAATYFAAAAVLVLVVIPTSALDAGGRDLVLRLTVLLAPFPSLAASSAVSAAGLYACGRFAIAPYSLSLRALGGLTVGGLWHSSWGLSAVALGLTLGEAARLLLLLATLGVLRIEKASCSRGRLSTGPFWRVAAPHTLSMVVLSATPLVDRGVAAGLQAGSTTVLELCDKLYYAPSVVVGSGLATVSGAQWARLSADPWGRYLLARDYGRSQALAWQLAAAVAVVAALAVWMVSDSLHAVANIPPQLPLKTTFAVLVIGLPFALSADLAVRILVILRRSWVFTASAVAMLVLTVVGDVLGARLIGLEGIAAASALVHVANAALLTMVSFRVLAAGSRTAPP